VWFKNPQFKILIKIPMRPTGRITYMQRFAGRKIVIHFVISATEKSTQICSILLIKMRILLISIHIFDNIHKMI
jgi:hypothetical protein